MSESMEYDGLIRGMGDIVYDTVGSGESLYHYNEEAPQIGRTTPTRDLSDDQSAPASSAPSQAQAQSAAPPAAKPVGASKPAGLKTPLILGLSAGALTAAGIYGYMRWKKPDEEGSVKLAGVAGGLSTLGVLVTVLAARGLKA